MASIRREPVTRFSRTGCGKSWACSPSTTERALLPGAVVDGVLVGGAGHRHVPLDRPVIGVVEALASVGLRRGVKQAPGLQLVGLEEPSGLPRPADLDRKSTRLNSSH